MPMAPTQARARMNSRVLPVATGILAAMNVVDGIRASSIAYFCAALGWALVGFAQWERWRSEAASSESPDMVPRRQKIAHYVTVVGFLLIIGGLATRWFA